MYREFYRLREKPFKLSPDPRYLFESASHQEAMSQFVYSVNEKAGFIGITGEVGTGKTTLINKFIASIPRNCDIASINHKLFSTKGLIQSIFSQFGIPFSRETTSELLIKLHQFLKKQHEDGKQSVLILDEAQSLSRNLLEDIRILSNIEAINEKYLNIFMLGQPELQAKLDSYDLRQLKDRVTQQYHLQPLSRDETRGYISHRLQIAASEKSYPDIFTEEAIDLIYYYTHGIPRKINIIAEKALLAGYVTENSFIDESLIEQVRQDGVYKNNKPAVKQTQLSAATANATPVQTGPADPVIEPEIESAKRSAIPLDSVLAENNHVPVDKNTGLDEAINLCKQVLSRLDEIEIHESPKIELSNLQILALVMILFGLTFLANLLAGFISP